MQEKRIHIEQWERRLQYHFFKDFEDPYISVVAHVDVTHLLNYCHKNQLSFFLTSLHCSALAVNQVQGMRLRMKDGDVMDYKQINMSATVFRPDTSFSFAFFPFEEDLNVFCEKSDRIVKKQIEVGGMDDPPDTLNVIYYSVVPWIHFSGLKHPRKGGDADSVPRIVFGKYEKQNEKYRMPVAVDVHHALADAYHIGQYFSEFQKRMDNLG
jgi:chloramphenicol O-acetyltransferase type A